MSTRKSGSKQAKSGPGARPSGNGESVLVQVPNLPPPPEVLDDVCVSAAELVDGVQEWLWRGYIPLDAYTQIVGPKGVCKTSLLARLAAMLTGGPPLLKGKKRPARNVLWWTRENNLNKDLKPRLVLAGCDLGHVKFPGRDGRGRGLRHLELPKDLPYLRAKIVQYEAAAVFLDPLRSCFRPGFDVNSDTEVANLLEGLHEQAGDLNCPILGSRHFKKGPAEELLLRINGAAAFGQVPRHILALLEHPSLEDHYVLSVEASGLSKPPPPWLCRKAEVGDTVRLDLVKELTGAAALAAEDLDRRTQHQADTDVELFLLGVLKGCEVKRKDVKTLAEAEKHSWWRVEQAFQKLGLVSRRQGQGKDHEALWSLPPGGSPTAPT